MKHRNITTSEWTPMAVDSLFSRGELPDWREFVEAMKHDPELAKTAMTIAERHEDGGSAALARILVARHHPALCESFRDDTDAGMNSFEEPRADNPHS